MKFIFIPKELNINAFNSRNIDQKGEERFSRIAEAYDVLSTPKIKTLYDQYGEEAIKQGIPSESNEEDGHVEKYTFHGDPMKVFLM